MRRCAGVHTAAASASRIGKPCGARNCPVNAATASTMAVAETRAKNSGHSLASTGAWDQHEVEPEGQTRADRQPRNGFGEPMRASRHRRWPPG